MKSNQTLTILFWHRKSKADSKGFAPIICRISLDGLREEFSIARKVHINNWDLETKRATACHDAKSINSTINRTHSDLERHFTVLQTMHKFITPLMLRNVYKSLPTDHKKGGTKPIPQNKIPTLLELTDLHIKGFSELVDKKIRSKETLKQWNSTRKKIAEFIIYEYQNMDMELSEIEYSFAQKFYSFQVPEIFSNELTPILIPLNSRHT